MLVEDNPGDVVLVREMLRASTGEFELQHAGRLVDALAALSDGAVDCLLLDLSLPDADGMEGLALVRERAPELPVVVLSGLSAEEAAMEALGAGAQDYLIKGHVDAHGIGRSIRYAISRQADQEALRTSEEHRGRLFNLMLRAEEQERVRIATELHDDTIQVMTAALMALDRLGAAVRAGELERIERTLAGARDMLGSAVERTRRLTFELRPPLLEAKGLGAAVRELAEQTGCEAGFEIDIDVSIGRHPFVVEELVYRVMREALANVRKHAEATRVVIRIWEEGDVIHASVADDGRGFDLDQALDRSRMRLHIGLDALLQRVRMAGGDIHIDTAPGQGTLLRVHLPASAHVGTEDGEEQDGAHAPR